MSDIFFLVLRRMRTPLIVLISVYAIATLGMTLIPGEDPSGEPWRMGFFHAFYFVSFMGTTIGFGEIPYPFTDLQRAWVLICIYTSVFAWLYGIGNVLRLLQDDTFVGAVAQRAFRLSIKRIDLPFHIICGYGETGQFIVRGLSELGIQAVIIDLHSDRLHSLELEELGVPAIVLSGDITDPENLLAAGINHPCCRGVIAVTQEDHTNLQIAVASKLINPNVPVICRSEIEDEADNMASVGTDAIINPYLIFGRRLSLLTTNPALHRIHNWFINQHSAEHINERITHEGLPAGNWIICGYGRFGKAVEHYSSDNHIKIKIIDIDLEATEAPRGSVVGRGTEADTLIEAGIESANVIVAATNDDANNLSILITAKQLNSTIVTIGRVSKESNNKLFIHANCDYIMRRSQVVANEVLTIISRPLVTKFLQYSSSLSHTATDDLITEICRLTNDSDPVTWRLLIDQQNAPAIVNFIDSQQSLTIGQVSSNAKLPAAEGIPLLLLRGSMSHLLPDPSMPLKIGDQLLFCAGRGQTLLAQRLSHNIELLDNLINQNQHHIPLLRWLQRRRQNKTPN
ncbi:MAG: Trk K+ transport system NAD-binding subunit [Arenicella sp.]|jgi:Trk K+ transport system NAD-binding subunit